MFTFVLILICYEALINIKGINYKGVLFSLFHAVLFINITKVLPNDYKISTKIINLMLIGMLIYAVLLFVNVMFKKPIMKKAALVVMALLMVSEIGINFVRVMDRDVMIYNITSYNHANKMMSDSVYSFKSGKDDFYRMEMHEGWTFNPGQLFNYQGISYYSSTMSGDAYNFFEGLGYRVYAKNVSTVYNPYSPILNSFFSIKYITDKTNSLELAGMNEIYSGDNFKILENETALPIAFMVNSDLMKWKADGSKRKAIDVHNDFLNSAMGEEVNVYERVSYDSATATNAELAYNDDWEKQLYTKLDPNSPVKFKFSYEINEEQVLCLEQGFKKGEIGIGVNGIVRRFDASREPLKAIGKVKAGDIVDIYIDIEDAKSGAWGIDVFRVNEEKFYECYNKLNENSAQIIKATDTKIKCRVNSDGEGILYTSIPNDGGWAVKCNGRKLPTHKIGNYLLAVVVPQGENTLEFSYHVPGLALGSVISIICLMLLVLYILIQRGKVNIKFIDLGKLIEIDGAKKVKLSVDSVENSLDGDKKMGNEKA